MQTTRWLTSRSTLVALALVLPLGGIACVASEPDPSGTGGEGGEVASGGSDPGGSGGTGGEVEPPANDQCPGEAVALDWDESYQASGSLVAAANDFQAFCTEMTAPLNDAVWAVTLEQGGTLSIDVTGNPHPALYIQSECGLDTYPAYCYETMTTGFHGHLDAGTWYVTVDGEGDFELDIRLDEPACGDGAINPEEQCDNGAGAPLDGCVDPGDALECTFGDLDPTLGVCPGQEHLVDPGQTVLLSSEAGLFTTGYGDDSESNVCGAYEGSDRVHMITPSQAGTLSVTIGLDEAGEVICHNATSTAWCWDHVLYARTTCDDAGTEITCADVINNETNEPETLSIPVEANVPYYVFVDGYDNFNFGPYNLLIELE
jgi:cysteine-rich repeat protein